MHGKALYNTCSLIVNKTTCENCTDQRNPSKFKDMKLKEYCHRKAVRTIK